MNIPNKIVFGAIIVFVASWCFPATCYVDDDAPNDPAPGNPAVSDPLEDGSQAHPFDAIQEAIDMIDTGDVVSVQTGIYYENLVFGGIDFVLTSSNPHDEAVVSNTIINGNNAGRVVTFSGTETPQCVISGLMLTNGYYRTFSPADVGGGIFGNGTAATIRYCIVSDNYAYAAGGGIAQCDGLIEYCVIDNNHSGGAGAIYDCAGVIKNCTITNNHSYNEPMTQGSAGGTITSSNASIENCIISNNVSASGSTINYCHGTISHCIISGNSILSSMGALASSGGGLANCNGPIKNCTITGNRSYSSAGMNNCGGMIENCIIGGNISAFSTATEVSNCPNIRFCCFRYGSGKGNFDADPLFVQYGYWADYGTPWDSSDDIWYEGNYHLKSAGWRWDSFAEQWTWDTVTSRCIDAGNPGMALGDEPMPDDIDPQTNRGENVRINIGVYGGTLEASIAPAGWAVLCDVNNSGAVNFIELTAMVDAWLQAGQNLPVDFSRNGYIDNEDFSLLAADWLKSTDW